MKELIKKAILCSLVAGFLQYGLSTSLVKAASHDDQQRRDQQQQDQRRYDWSQDAYRNDNWHGTSRQYNESSPFKWHESRSSMNERFSSDYRMDRIDDDAWNNRFQGLHSYRWHDSDRYSQGDFWYRGVRVHDAVLFYDDSDELVGTGFMFDNEFVFIRDDQEVYRRNDSLLLRTISLVLKF